ncbi:hypothetical protein CRG98_025492 [Punica granatum]|uniref:Uncharacterized protein n=1 Tax=Punica granatum TaxID=22663 RepID=A0A2I0JD12_PUNGR|nr:hypothetical protein CRG98_025492 [Punica granatum]
MYNSAASFLPSYLPQSALPSFLNNNWSVVSLLALRQSSPISVSIRGRTSKETRRDMGDERGGRAVVELKLDESVWSECSARAVVELKLDDSVWLNPSLTSPFGLNSSCCGARAMVEL